MFELLYLKYEFESSVDPDEGAHNLQPHLDLHCLPSSLRILIIIELGPIIFSAPGVQEELLHYPWR